MEPVSRRELIKRLRKLGFQGPFSARKHSVMSKGRLKLRIPIRLEVDMHFLERY